MIRRASVRRLAPVGQGALALVVFLAFWLAASQVIGTANGVPTPLAVFRWWYSARSIVSANARQTISEAARGFVIGNVAALAVAVLAFFFVRVERVLISVAVMSYCLPLVAIGPLLQITFNGDTPEVILAALSVFFTTMIGILSGLRSAPRTTLDVVRSLGGRNWSELRFVRAQSAVGPAMASLTLAAPAAVLGAIVGEFLGGETGLGVALINAQKTADPAQAWAYCLSTVVIAGTATALVGFVARMLTPWQRQGVPI
jgi:ABC-type nitrate/sulfonate/bicarbonate transport system permease component